MNNQFSMYLEKLPLSQRVVKDYISRCRKVEKYEGDLDIHFKHNKGQSLIRKLTIDEMINNYLNEVFSHLNDFEKETVLRSIELLNKAMAKSSFCCMPSS